MCDFSSRVTVQYLCWADQTKVQIKEKGWAEREENCLYTFVGLKDCLPELLQKLLKKKNKPTQETLQNQQQKTQPWTTREYKH